MKTNAKKQVKKMWFEWGDEPAGHCHVWHVGEDGGICMDGVMPIEQAREICAHMECPFN